MAKPTLLYIDHIAHNASGSNLFLKEMLSRHFEVTSRWVNPWGNPRVITPDEINRYEYVLFFQRINQFSELKQITAKIIWVAVYDSLNTDYFYWKALSTLPIKILSFNHKVNEKANRFGIENAYFKYYPDPEELKDSSSQIEGKRILFWYRGTVTWEHVKSVLNPDEIESLTFRNAPDPGFNKEVVSESDIQKYKIRFDNRPFGDTNILREMLREHTIFIQPRQMEGIGQAYLEALASGHCVIANDDATMNEYIENGKNGIIVNYQHPKRISLDHYKTLGDNALKSCIQGRKEWLASEDRLVGFVIKPTIKPHVNLLTKTIWHGIYALKHALFEIKQSRIRARMRAQKENASV